jgi:eukaryotic-like serine/threonine-protein kinase
VGTLLGAYRVEGVLGSGSMGEVFRCVDVGLNRRVAIKILSEKHRDSAELRARFIREGQAVAAVSHPNVVQVFATGTFDDRPYIAMEFLDGTDLGSLVERQGPLDSSIAVRAAFDAASGLEAASRAGLIHRDVKPSNLVQLRDGTVKVTDFGLAKPVDPGVAPALTAMGVVVGTPDYIAPEQARGETIDERVDIYALGGTLFFLLTAIPPFRTGRPADDKYLKVVARHLRQPAPSATERKPSVDPELSALGQQMMAKRRDDRPPYPELLQRLSMISTRLDPTGDPLGARGSRPISVALVSRPPVSRPPGSRPPVMSSPLASVAPGPPSLASPPLVRSAPAHAERPAGEGAALGSAMPSTARAQTRDPSASDQSLPPVPPLFPRWSIGVTIAALALFVTGLVVYLGRPAASRSAPVAAPVDGAVDVPSRRDAADATARPELPPPGTILVMRADGRPLYVDARPVTTEAFRSVFAKHQQKTHLDGNPVLSVSYNAARSYAKTIRTRLLTAEEWTLASTMPGFVVIDKLYEWVESDGARRTAKKHGDSQLRKDQEYDDVTFRLAREP